MNSIITWEMDGKLHEIILWRSYGQKINFVFRGLSKQSKSDLAGKLLLSMSVVAPVFSLMHWRKKDIKLQEFIYRKIALLLQKMAMRPLLLIIDVPMPTLF